MPMASPGVLCSVSHAPEAITISGHASEQQGLCVSRNWGRREDECDGWGGVLGVSPQAGGNLCDVRAVQETDGSILEERHHGGSLPGMQGTLVLSQGHILGPRQAVLQGRMSPPDRT